jgi:DNA-binding MarR family transcriptional regulator
MQNLKNIIAQLSRIIGQTEEAAKEELNLSELTLTQMHYLETISLIGNPNFTELASAMRLSKPTVKVSIDKLIEKDFVFKVRSDEDRRSSHLHLAKKGELINGMHDYAHKHIADIFEKKLNLKEQEILIDLLNKVLSD